jgi:electron transport complex protein RnfA
MYELVLIIVAAALVNNFVLVQFLGLCPFLGASRRLEGAIGMGLATGLVLTIASGMSYLVERFLLIPFGVQYLRLVSFILVIGAAVQFTELLLRRVAPLLHRVLGLYIPLIASN